MAKVNLDVKVEEAMKIKLRYMGEQLSVGYADVVREALSKKIQEFEKSNGKINVEKIKGEIKLFEENAKK